MAGGRSARPPGVGIRASVPYKVFASVVLTLIFLATLIALISSSTGSGGSDSSSAASGGRKAASFFLRPYVSRTFLALKSDPLRIRLDLVHKQAADHIALVNAYSSYARRLKLENSRLLQTFLDLASNFSDLVARFDAATASVDAEHPLDEDVVRAFEKELKDKVKLARLLISESKESFDTQLKIQKLRDTIFAVNEQLHRAKKLGSLSSAIAAGSTPKSLHCLDMRLVEERVSKHKDYERYYSAGAYSSPDYYDPDLFHYALFTDNVIAAAVVINSTIKNAADPKRHVFHLVTDTMSLAAFQVWFHNQKPPRGARIEIRSTADFPFLNESYSPMVRLVEGGRADLRVLDHLKFYLPELFPKLRRIVYLEDDVVVQRDLAALSRMDLDGRVNGAVEMCFGPFHRYSRYLNFSVPEVRQRFSPKACAWGFGVNVFDLDAWRRDKCTDIYHKYMNLNEDSTLWNLGETLPAGLMTFYMNTKPLDKMWHLMGLGYNPSISQDEIRRAAVVHFNGIMKPWLDIAMNQYKHLWMNHVNSEVGYLQLCNFGV